MSVAEFESGHSAGPLAGIRVIDLTSVVLGPFATQSLADYGADVVKVESPEGDLMRANGVSRNRGMSSIYLYLNRNKRSIAIDLKTPEGIEALKRLIATADVFVHNMRVKAIERLGLGYEVVKAVNPEIIYCAATGFGEGGSHAGLPAFDDIIQGACGLADLVGRESGAPAYPPTLLADKIAGMAVSNAILAACVHRATTGEGQYVEVPMFESMVAFTMAEHLGGKTFAPAIGPTGYARLVEGGRKPIQSKDGHLSMLPYTTQQWRKFFEWFKRSDLAAKYSLDDRHELNRRIGELYADLRSITLEYTTAELLDACLKLDIPCTEIYSIENIDEHPHVKSVKLFETKSHPTEGDVVSIRPTALFSKTPTSIRRLAPSLGQDSSEILREAGFDQDSMDQLYEKRVVYGPCDK